jgi:hypothetical protein
MSIPQNVISLVFNHCNFNNTIFFYLSDMKHLHILKFIDCGHIKASKLRFDKKKYNNLYSLKIIGDTKFSTSIFKIFNNIRILTLNDNFHLYKYINQTLLNLTLYSNHMDLSLNIIKSINITYLSKLKIISRTYIEPSTHTEYLLNHILSNCSSKLNHLKLINLGFHTDQLKTLSKLSAKSLTYLFIGTTCLDYFKRKIEFGDPVYLINIFPNLEHLLIDKMMVVESEVLQMIAGLHHLIFLQLSEKVYITQKVMTSLLTGIGTTQLCFLEDQ